MSAANASAPTRVLAVDIDGCLNNEDTYRNADRDALIYTATEEHSTRLLEREHCERVQRICDATGAALVIVSAWRCFFSAEQIARMFAARGLTAPVLGAVARATASGDQRADALLEWLAEHPEVTAWCVLDDDTRAYGYRRSVNGPLRYHNPRFVDRCVHPRDGVTDDDAARCIAILRGEVTP